MCEHHNIRLIFEIYLALRSATIRKVSACFYSISGSPPKNCFLIRCVALQWVHYCAFDISNLCGASIGRLHSLFFGLGLYQARHPIVSDRECFHNLRSLHRVECFRYNRLHKVNQQRLEGETEMRFENCWWVDCRFIYCHCIYICVRKSYGNWKCHLHSISKLQSK